MKSTTKDATGAKGQDASGEAACLHCTLPKKICTCTKDIEQQITEPIGGCQNDVESGGHLEYVRNQLKRIVNHGTAGGRDD